MKIESIHIKNFRSFKEDIINFDDYTCLVGANGAGKSTVFTALQVFFRNSKDSKTDLTKLSERDFHHYNISEPIEITVTFCDLSAKAKEDLKDYARQDKLIVTAKAVYDSSKKFAEVKQYGNRLGIEDFREYFDKDKSGASAPELLACYNSLRDSYIELPVVKAKAAMAQALQEYESNNPDSCNLIPSEDQFYGASKGSNRLAPHVQWIFVPASKDATEEGEETKTSALGQLLLRTVRSRVNFSDRIAALRNSLSQQYADLLESERAALDELSTSLKEKLTHWAHPSIDAKVAWKQDEEKTIKIEEPVATIQLGERGFEGELARFGHGLQRSYMLALLQELVSLDQENSPTLILAIEEPELYQHPPQARYLAEVLMDLSNENAQVMVCSHSPLFIPRNDFEKIRIIRELGTPVESRHKSTTYQEISKFLTSIGGKPINKNGIVAKLFPFLSPTVNEMFFCKRPVFVEGIEDVAYLKAYIELMEVNPIMRTNGVHIINADKKSNIIEPLAVANILEIPAFVIYDSDSDADPIHHHIHKTDNKKLLTIQGYSDEDEFQSIHLSKPNLFAWSTNMGDGVISEIVNWSSYFDRACAEFGNAGGLKKNPLVIARTLELAWNDGKQSESLKTLVLKIVEFSSN